jgi:TolB-like protein
MSIYDPFNVSRIDPASPSRATGLICFGIFELNAATGELRRRGFRIGLQEQPFRILLALLERPGRVVGRDELCHRLWPQGTFVDFEHSLNAAVRRLRVALSDDAEVPRFVETVHKRGYRFLSLNLRTGGSRVGNGRRDSETNASPVVTRARLAVLPFNPCDVFADELTEETRTQLAQVCPRVIDVIARTAVARAQRDAEGAAEIGMALSADYLLEGYVRRDGQRVRITAQLIEPEEEAYLWARTFECVITDPLSLQIDVAEAIATAVTHALTDVRRATA